MLYFLFALHWFSHTSEIKEVITLHTNKSACTICNFIGFPYIKGIQSEISWGFLKENSASQIRLSVIKLQWCSCNYLFYSYFTVHEFVIGSFKHEKLLQTTWLLMRAEREQKMWNSGEAGVCLQIEGWISNCFIQQQQRLQGSRI